MRLDVHLGNHPACQFGEIHPGKVMLGKLRVEARSGDQLLDHVCRAVDAFDDLLHGVFAIRVAGGLLCDLRLGLDSRQGRAQLMRSIGGKLAFVLKGDA